MIGRGGIARPFRVSMLAATMPCTHGKRITVTGGSGFVGQLLRRRWGHHQYRVDVFDPYRGRVVDALRRTWVGAGAAPDEIPRAKGMRERQASAERRLRRARLLRPSGDDMLGLRSRLTDRFRGSDAVIHLAALAHPNVKGAAAEDYRRINYEGAINVFEAARDAGVTRFVFASSAQVYGINAPVTIDQFPILESNPLPTLAEGQSQYGYLKGEFEQYLVAACTTGETQAVSLRLECPGVRSDVPWNFYASTSVENTVQAFSCAIDAELASQVEICNVIDATVAPAIVDVQSFLAESWPDVPNHTTGNDGLLSIDRARRVLGYQPVEHGTYFPLSLIWG